MKKTDVFIAEPCEAAWDEMHGGNDKRFCDLCTKNVHHLSGMTRRQAEKLISAPRPSEGLCVRYAYDQSGELVFEPKRVAARAPLSQQRGALRMLAAASAAVSLVGLATGAAMAQSPPNGSGPNVQVMAGGISAHDWDDTAPPTEEVEENLEEEEDDRSAAELAAENNEPVIELMGDVDPYYEEMGDIAEEPCDPTTTTTEEGGEEELIEEMGEAPYHPEDDPEIMPTMGEPVIEFDEEALYQQEEQAAGQLSVFGIELEEEEIECDPQAEDDCDGTLANELDDEYYPTRMGRRAAPINELK